MKHPAWCYNAVLYEMNVRQLTPEGTLCAATQYLDMLHDMGINVVWLMPIYPIGQLKRKGSLGSYYSIQEYCAVNPELGTCADLDAFIARAHTLGMKVLLDWVANHTARDARWVREKPADWYERDEQGEPLVPWDWTDTAKLNYDNHAVWQGQIEAMRFWVTEHAVDGFRCDMAMLVPIEFWRETAAALRQLNPDIFLLAEAEQQDLFPTFDMCYGWEMHHILNDLAQKKVRLPVLLDWLHADMDRYPRSAIRMAFTSNHDENSWSDSEFTRLGAAREILAAFTFLVPGAMPLIYTGQEVGYDHCFDFFDHDPMPSYRPNEFTTFYQRLIRLRHTCPALCAGEWGGDLVEIHNNAEDCLLVMVREVQGSRMVAQLNLSPYVVHAEYNTGIYAGEYTDVMTGGPVLLPPTVVRDMAPWEYHILTK